MQFSIFYWNDMNVLFDIGQEFMQVSRTGSDNLQGEIN